MTHHLWLTWEIALHPDADTVARALPRRIVTPGFSAMPGQLPHEIGVLLPTQDDPLRVVGHLKGERGDAAGLFLANPFLNLQRTARRIKERDIRWVANVPSVTQHAADFVDRLADVDLGAAKEIAALQAFAEAGLKTLATIVRPSEAAMAVAGGCDGLFVIPPVEAFEAGFPSARFRADQLAGIRAAVPGFGGPILCLLTEAERARPATWPSHALAGVVRPKPYKG